MTAVEPMKHFFIVLNIIAFLSLPVPGLRAGEDQPKPGLSSPTETVALQLRWFHQFQFAGYYAAIEKGFYREAGLEVFLIEGGYDKDTIEEVVNGRADFGVTNSEILLHRLKGKPLVVLAAVFQHSPLVLISRKEKGILYP